MTKVIYYVGGVGDGHRQLLLGSVKKYATLGHPDIEGRLAIYEHEETSETGGVSESRYRYVKTLETSEAIRFLEENDRSV